MVVRGGGEEEEEEEEEEGGEGEDLIKYLLLFLYFQDNRELVKISDRFNLI